MFIILSATAVRPSPAASQAGIWANSPLRLTGGGLAVPLELPVLRDFACEWYFRHEQNDSASTSTVPSFISLFPLATLDISAADERCNIPAIAKLAGEIITAARILNALVSK